MSPIRDGALLALGTLTALPVPAPSRVDRTRAGIAMVLAPVAATIPAAFVALAGLVAQLVQWPAMLAAALAVTGVALTTRGLHLDGLADTADGLAASYDRERALQVMRRGDTGPAGMAAVVLVLVLQVAALAAVLERPWGWLLGAVAVCGSRAALVVACHRVVPPARGSGLGAAVAGSVSTPMATCTLAVVGAWLALAAWPGGQPVAQGAAALGVSTVIVAGLVARCTSRLGGVTGDVMGACVEVGLVVLLVVLAAS